MMVAHDISADLLADATGALLRRARVLVVDDQAANVQTLHQVFADDYQVFAATSGEQALLQCAKQAPDLVVLDIEMPGMDGLEVCRRLKTDLATRDIPVIFVTSHGDEATETVGLDLGAVDFLSKPINPRIVRARVKTHLALKAKSDLLRHWVYIDGLTGVYNRRCFDERLASEWGRAARNKTALSVLLVDVDAFKRFNDRYGHQSGDECLRRVAQAVGGSIRRPGDLVARYGGEEFACLLPETDLPGALVVAGQVRSRVQELGIEHAESGVAPVVTVSIGVCSRPASVPGSIQALVASADRHLYQAKANGRNQVCGATLEPGA
jgi:diguanylate cyclase (GGDEF)-like protein